MTTPSPTRRYPSLRRTEAETRAAALTVDAVEVELDLTAPDAATFGSRTTLRFSSRAPETFVDFRGEELTEATLNGRPVPPERWQAGRLALDGLAAENTLVVAGRMAYSSDGEGLHRHVDPADGATYLYAMSFLDAAPRWFACFDQPDLKARYRFAVTAPPEWTVLGNGPSEPAGPGRWTLVPPEPLSTYFVTLVAGPYASVTAEHDGIELGFHVRASLRRELEAEAPDLVEVTARSFDFYHRLFGVRYPFGEYHQAFVPDFNAGAMENPGCVTFRDSFVYRGRATDAERAGRASVIAHEMAHQWFGDLVTMRWWDDLWLNESFAEYMGHRCCTDATRYPVWTEFGIRRKNWGAVADQAPSTHPVAGTGAVDAAAALQDFDGISYAKGAAVLRQLVAYLGDDVFVAGLRTYFTRHAFGNAEFAELIACWTDAGAVDLEAWAAAWLRTAGMDTLDVAPAATGAVVTVTGPDGGPSPRPHALTVAGVDAAGAVTPLVDLVLRGDAAPIAVPDGTVLVVPDGTDATWARVRFGADGWSDVAAVLPTVEDEAVLVVVHNAVRDAVRDATLDPAVALDLVTASLAGVQPEVLVTVVLGATSALAGPYSPVAERPERLARLHALALAVVDSSPAGSDRQLAGFRQAVASSADVDRLRAWAAGHDLPPGLALDSELTWTVVERLVELTGDDAVLDRTLAQDSSSSAAVHAARARAARPTAAAKEEAWRLLTQPSEVSAYEVYATAEGFFRAGQEELTAPYVERYFAEIGATAEFRRGWALGRVAGLAFPHLAADARTVALAERALAGDLPDPVRREVVDGLDLLRRAVASLERFAG
ncbi:Membrane alanyl aminopeptidase Metallo peptidase. MEROPS family M01 [Friedmanniella luteola]|uniref:Aminopeptidase N n=1 Tax=Friedmanniella luteola TaxID=546871 RepID=A0A1H1NDD6_9ACTN|nr:aminopeptidase N [Friedmanniella luteola]SDR96963.1 Membrane alanyl aminopeptidase Metallo peptidase. MEROPS family M01 [Friedmanniella luteola]